MTVGYRLYIGLGPWAGSDHSSRNVYLAGKRGTIGLDKAVFGFENKE